jgi:predicted DNA-binding protein (MmcQ/YjbR family)
VNLDKLRELCLSLPGATEGIKWEDHICFMVAEKMFCITGESGGASIKLTPEDFDELTERDGVIPAPYMAHNKWVNIMDFARLKDKEWGTICTSILRPHSLQAIKESTERTLQIVPPYTLKTKKEQA